MVACLQELDPPRLDQIDQPVGLHPISEIFTELRMENGLPHAPPGLPGQLAAGGPGRPRTPCGGVWRAPLPRSRIHDSAMGRHFVVRHGSAELGRVGIVGGK